MGKMKNAQGYQNKTDMLNIANKTSNPMVKQRVLPIIKSDKANFFSFSKSMFGLEFQKF